MSSEKRPKFGVDLDGVLFSWDIGATLALKMRGCDVEVREALMWDEIQHRVSKDDWHWVWHDGMREIFELAPVYPGMKDALRRIQEILDIVVITHRPRGVIDITLRRLAELKLRPVAVHHVQGEDKCEVAPNCIGYVDDKLENVIAYAAAFDQIPVFVPRRPWNSELHDDPNPNIITYDSPDELVQWAKEVTS